MGENVVSHKLGRIVRINEKKDVKNKNKTHLQKRSLIFDFIFI